MIHLPATHQFQFFSQSLESVGRRLFTLSIQADDMLCRCDQHGWPDEGTNPYVARIETAGATNEAVICGRCEQPEEQPGDIYLNDREYYKYVYSEKRLYTFKEQNILQIRVSDSPKKVKESQTRDEDNPPNGPRESNTDSAADADW